MARKKGEQEAAAPAPAAQGQEHRERVHRLTGVWLPDCGGFERTAAGKVKFSQAMLVALGQICASDHLAKVVERTQAPSCTLFGEILPAVEAYEREWLDGGAPAPKKKAGAS